jgi:hypothetical protein
VDRQVCEVMPTFGNEIQAVLLYRQTDLLEIRSRNCCRDIECYSNKTRLVCE